MPFTLAHPAAVLPLLRGALVGAALVAGSLAPDVPYFLVDLGIPNSAQAWYEPFLNGTTSHSLAGVLTVDLPAALVLYLAWLLVCRPLCGKPAARAGVGWIAVSLLLGIATHLVWDELTWTRLVQHLSTASGMIVLAVFLWQRRPEKLDRRLFAIPVVAAAGAAVGVARLDEFTAELVLSEAAKGAIVAVTIALAVYVAVWWARRF